MSSEPSNPPAYDIKVEDPKHIPDLVNVTQELGKYNTVILGLDHQEGYEGRHAMRGRYEDLGDLEPGEEVFRRPDGGNTVYTDDSKYALNFGIPIPPVDHKKANTYTAGLHDFINERTDATLQEGQRDMYLGGDQIVGVSQRFGNESVVLRGYWAEDMPNVYDLMYKDGLSTEEVEAHQQAMQKSADVMGSQEFYQKVMDEFHADELTSTEFLEGRVEEIGKTAEELLEETNTREPKVCFLERPE
jgi:lipoate-protein ligase A